MNAATTSGTFDHGADDMDPLELVACEIARYRFEHRLTVTARVTDDDRGQARRFLESLLIGYGRPWHLVRFERDQTGRPFSPHDVSEIAEVWEP